MKKDLQELMILYKKYIDVLNNELYSAKTLIGDNIGIRMFMITNMYLEKEKTTLEALHKNIMEDRFPKFILKKLNEYTI